MHDQLVNNKRKLASDRFDQLFRSMNIHSLGHLIAVLRDSRMTVTETFDEVEDVEGLEEEEFSGKRL